MILVCKKMQGKLKVQFPRMAEQAIRISPGNEATVGSVDLINSQYRDAVIDAMLCIHCLDELPDVI